MQFNINKKFFNINFQKKIKMQEDIKPQVATGIRTKKLRFDRKFSSTNPLLKELFQKQKVETKSCEFMKNKKNLMTLNSAEEFKCFCYWHPELFGVDEVSCSKI